MDAFKVVVITPTTGICRIEYAQSLARMVMYFALTRVFADIEDQWLIPDAISGSGIGANYSAMVKKHLADDNQWTHFLSIEDDMGFEPDVLHILARRKLPIVGCTYKTNKGWPIRWTAIKKNRIESLDTDETKSGVEEAYVIPQGVTLVSREVFEKTEQPWFMPGYNKETGVFFAQDYHFCLMAAKAGFPCYIDHDASKKIWHVGVKNYRWDMEDNNGHFTGSL